MSDPTTQSTPFLHKSKLTRRSLRCHKKQ